MTETETELPAITKAQRRVLRIIANHWRQPGYGPTVRYISAECGFASPVGAACHLHALKKKGYITWDERVARSIRLTGAAI